MMWYIRYDKAYLSGEFMKKEKILKIAKCVFTILEIAVLGILLFAVIYEWPKLGAFLLSILVLILIFNFLKLILLISRVKKALKRVGFKILKTSLKYRCAFVSATRGEEKAIICTICRKGAYVRYHFESTDKIEIYKRTREISVTDRSGRYYKGTFRTRKIGTQSIKWPRECSKTRNVYFVFDKHPWQMTDSVRKEELDDGMIICNSNVMLYDIETFLKTLI